MNSERSYSWTIIFLLERYAVAVDSNDPHKGGDNAVETTNQSGGILSRFAQGQNIDEPLAESTSSGIDYYEADGLGSITSLTNGVGTVAQTYTYDSFGNTTAGDRCAMQARRRRLRRRSRDTRCFSILSTVEGLPRSGSEISRCTCSGITT